MSKFGCISQVMSRVLVIVVVCLSTTSALRVVGVNTVPLAGDANAPWVLEEQRAASGPLGMHLTRLLEQCQPNSLPLEFVSWQRTSRDAESSSFGDVGVAAVFPVLREWQTANTAGATEEFPGQYFLPVISSPGTTILVDNTFKTTSVTESLFSRDIGTILIAMSSLSVIAGVGIWLSDRHHRKSNFPGDFKNGAGIGIWWALVTLTTVGYGDRVPKSKSGRAIGMLWMLIGVMMLALLQGTVIEKLTTSADTVYLSQLEKTADNIPGLRVGCVNGSAEEWRMRALGAHVTLYSDTQTAIRALEDNADPLAAVAIDMLAAGIAVNTLSRTGNVRPSGIIQDTLTYGYLLQPGVQNWTQTVSFKSTDMSLIQCLELNVRIGTGELNAEVHFRKYETMAFDENEDLADRNAQNKQFSQSQVLSSTLLPLFAILVLILAFLLDRLYLTNGQQYEDMHLSDSEEPHGGERPNGTITAGKLAFLKDDEDDAMLLISQQSSSSALDGDLSLASTA